MTRVFRFLRRLDRWYGDRINPDCVSFSPVCCPPGSPVRSGRAGQFRLCPPGHTPHSTDERKPCK